MTTAAELQTMVEACLDRTLNVVQRFVLRTGDTWTVPENFIGMRVQMIGPGSDGGTGGTTGGGGGGGAGAYLDLFVADDGTNFPAGTVLTALNDLANSVFKLTGTGFELFAERPDDASNAVTTAGGAGAAGTVVGRFGRTGTGAGGAAGADGQPGGGADITSAGGGGGGSAGANGGNGADTYRTLNGRISAQMGSIGYTSPGVLGGAGATVGGKQGSGGKGFGAGGGGGGGSSTGKGGGGAGGFYVPEYPSQAAGGGATSTAGGTGSPGVAVLTVFRGGAA